MLDDCYLNKPIQYNTIYHALSETFRNIFKKKKKMRTKGKAADSLNLEQITNFTERCPIAQSGFKIQCINMCLNLLKMSKYNRSR